MVMGEVAPSIPVARVVLTDSCLQERFRTKNEWFMESCLPIVDHSNRDPTASSEASSRHFAKDDSVRHHRSLCLVF